MTHWMHLGLCNAVVAGLIAMAAAVVTWRGRCRPAVAYGLWLLVLVKLVTPPLVCVPLTWPASEEVEELIAGPSCPAMEARPVAEAVAPSDIELAPTETPTDWPPLVAGAWLAGSLAFAALALWRISRLLRWLRSLSAAPATWQKRVDRLADRIGLRRSPRVLVTPHGAVPPLVVGLAGRPVLVFPLGLWDRLEESQRDAVLLHELAHLRRGDHRVRLLELAALTLYWWLPLAWWASRRLRQAEEECCDTWVTWAAPDDRPAYAAALVETVAFLSGQSVALPVGASGAGPVVAMKRRLSMILREKTTPGLSRLGWALMLGALALMPLMPTLVRGQPKKETKGETPTTMSGLLSTKSCVKCHAPTPAAKAFDADLHGRIIGLMDALKKQREQAEKTERELKAVLDRFEKSLETPKKEGKREPLEEEVKRLREKVERLQRGLANQTEMYKELEQLRLKDQKEKLRQRMLLEKAAQRLNELERSKEQQRAKPEEEVSAAGQVHFMREREFEIPYDQSVKPDTPMSLFLRRDGEAKWKLFSRMKESKGVISFTAPADGVYQFYFRIEGHDVILPADWKPTLTVVVDTVKPVITAKLRDQGTNDIELEWTIREDHPDLRTLVVEYRLKDEKEWRKFRITPLRAAKFVTRLDERDQLAEVRMRMRDMAGNEGETILKR